MFVLSTHIQSDLIPSELATCSKLNEEQLDQENLFLAGFKEQEKTDARNTAAGTACKVWSVSLLDSRRMYHSASQSQRALRCVRGRGSVCLQNAFLSHSPRIQPPGDSIDPSSTNRPQMERKRRQFDCHIKYLTSGYIIVCPDEILHRSCKTRWFQLQTRQIFTLLATTRLISKVFTYFPFPPSPRSYPF
ncbi:hypothetical protein RRG08_025345 [Elysia crispata]|uniref:Uncharacterized protein n=1 Tax=Elysia crispata TaxID=231223 RepID=A0AAE1DUZ1_9GAST|nr:hypothetical protein RRG08_025345 [Elysia crispata]